MGNRQEDRIKCEIPDSYNFETRESQYEYLTFEEAVDSGYCGGCGQFWMGCSSYDFSPIKGFCEHCVDEILSNT